MKLIAILILSLVTTASASAIEFHVAPDGNDANPGTAAQPFATLDRARDAVRAAKASGAVDEPLRVRVAGGEYTLTKPFALTPEDSGTADAPVVYAAAPGETPVFSGGRVIVDWQEGADGLWTAQIPEVAEGAWYFEQLFVNGRRAVRARTPNKFYFYMQDLHEEILEQGPGRVPARAVQTVRLRPNDFEQSLGQIPADELGDVHMLVYHKWDNTRRHIHEIDPETATLRTRGTGMKSWNPWYRNARFHLENFRAALDVPGEWFLERDGTLHYLPLPGEDMARAEVVAPVVERFIEIAGDPARERFVEHVAIEGLHFKHAQWLTPPTGFEAEQAAASIEAVVQVDGARHIRIESCSFGHFGTYAVWFREGCSDAVLRRCHIYDFGAGGVRIGETTARVEEARQTSRIVVDNNIIRHGGRIFPCAVGLWIGHSPDNQVTHNEIADLYYTGISVGWRWGYDESLAKRNEIAYNRVHHIGWGVLSDMGGIYTLGPSEGTHVHGNVFHDIYAYSYGGWGLYTDEGSTGILFENNLVHDTKTGSFHQHYGKENVVRNNILAFSEAHQIQATRVEDHLSFTLENNIVYYDTGDVLSGPWDRVRFESRANLFWQKDGGPVRFMGGTLEAWQAKGHEEGSRVADPGFANPEAGDYTLAVDSPARALGFVPFDYTKAGVYGDPDWVALAEAATMPPLEIAPKAPPVSIHDTFETTAPGRKPSGGEAMVQGGGDAILVTDETAAEGRHSLKLVDAPGLSQTFYPYYVYSNLGYREGTVRSSFALRIASDTRLGFEWRDYTGGNYKTGPKFSIHDRVLRTPDGRSFDMPQDQWISFEITCEVGGEGGTWQLRADAEGMELVLWDTVPFASSDFRVLDWIGFMSVAEKETTCYLDEFRLFHVEDSAP